MPFFRHDGHRLAYTISGTGPRVASCSPGCCSRSGCTPRWPARSPSATTASSRSTCSATAARPPEGHVALLHDHLRASRSIALLDHLEIDEAVVGGTSLGANVTLDVAALAPERLRGMIVEMPVLDNALLGCAIAFTPLMVALTFGEPAMKLVQAGAKLVPSRGLPFWGDIGLDWIRQDPAPSAAVLQGLFFGRVAPHRTPAQDLRGAGAGHRAPPRPGAPVLRRRRARRRAAQRPPRRGRTRSSSCGQARAADRRVRRLRRRVLEAQAREATGVAPLQARRRGAA